MQTAFGKIRLVCEKNTREMMVSNRARLIQSTSTQVKALLPESVLYKGRLLPQG